jgi:isoleucyl-tRNA synthetase
MEKKQYREVKQLNLPQLDQEVLQHWREKKIFDQSMSSREGQETFVFFEGPPSVNAMPGIHHVMARTIKDTFCRYQTLKNKLVYRKGGWDTHGLPIELNVEKRLGITKEDIGTKISLEDFNTTCRKDALTYIDAWNQLTEQMGYWVDMLNPYVTFHTDYIETLWHLLQKIYDKGYLYKSYKIQPYSPAAGTGLSTHELNQPGCYKEVTDTSAVAMFKLKHSPESAFLFDDAAEDVRFLAWTTTPWTLPSNTALTVGGNIAYVKIKTNNPYTHAPVSVILAKTLVNNWFGEKKATILSQSEAFVGSALAGLRYEQLLDFGNEVQPLNDQNDAFRVLVGDFVTTEDGTGIVHTAPAFGADDMKVARANGIGILTLVDKQGKFIDTVGEFSGRYVKDYKNDPNYVNVDIDIAVHLKQTGKAFNVQKYVHNYPHCWRTDKPVLYYPLDSWFIRVTAVKDRLVELNKTINWKPEHTGTGRFGNWLENVQDWNLSRSRFWGVPLPIWRTEDDTEEVCVGSVEQLLTGIEQAIAKGYMTENPYANKQLSEIDLHRPYIDKVVLVSPSGKPMYREPDLIDGWFDSGAMPYAQWHYPFENKDIFAQNFPADFIAEGVDQTRGWFYTLHVLAGMLFNNVAYKAVVSNGLVLDAKGVKMSKRLGNGIDPFLALNKYGTDAVRWYMLSNANPWDDLRFSWTKVRNEAGEVTSEYSTGIEEVRNKFLGTLYNTYSFFALYANIDGFDYSEADIPMEERPEIDRWIISFLNSLTKEVDAAFADYDATRAARLIQTFVTDHLSNWYVRLCRRRFWKGEQGKDKTAAYQTLYQCLEWVSILMSPIAPFISDFVFRHLNEVSGRHSVDSVHLSLIPTVNEQHIDKALEERMALAQNISSMVLALRKRIDMKVRQPLQKILVPILNPAQKGQIERVKDLILSETNVKELEYVSDTSGIVTKSIKPDFKKLGKKLGAKMKAASEKIAQFSQEDIRQIERNGSYDLSLDGETYPILLDEVLIHSEDIKGWMVNSQDGLTVALDVQVTPELEQEGIVREVVYRIQNHRKSSDEKYSTTDAIKVTLQIESNKDEKWFEKLKKQLKDRIEVETLADWVIFKKQLSKNDVIDYKDDFTAIRGNIEKVSNLILFNDLDTKVNAILSRKGITPSKKYINFSIKYFLELRAEQTYNRSKLNRGTVGVYRYMTSISNLVIAYDNLLIAILQDGNRDEYFSKDERLKQAKAILPITKSQKFADYLNKHDDYINISNTIEFISTEIGINPKSITIDDYSIIKLMFDMKDFHIEGGVIVFPENKSSQKSKDAQNSRTVMKYMVEYLNYVIINTWSYYLNKLQTRNS